VKVIGRLPGETTCLALVWAVLNWASLGWRGLTMTPKGLRLLQDLRRQLLHPPMPEKEVDQASPLPPSITVTPRPEPFTPLIRCHRLLTRS
jgi:hypothetical protein